MTFRDLRTPMKLRNHAVLLLTASALVLSSVTAGTGVASAQAPVDESQISVEHGDRISTSRPPQAEEGQTERPSASLAPADGTATTAHTVYCSYNAVPPYFDGSGSWLLGEAWFTCNDNVSARYIDVCVDYYTFGEWVQWGCASWEEYGPGTGLWYRAWMLCDFTGTYQYRTRAYFESVDIHGYYEDQLVTSAGGLMDC